MSTGVFHDVDIAWKGETYAFTPSNRLLRKIEGEIAPSTLGSVLQRVASGNPPFSEIAYILSVFLRAAGCRAEDCNEDELYRAILEDVRFRDGKQYYAITDILVQVVSPSEDAAKK